MTKRISQKWFVQEGQKIKGPYTPLEIQTLLAQGKIHGKSLVSGGPKDNHSKTVNDLVQSLADPVYSLFNALQFAQNITHSLGREIAKTPLKHYQSKIGTIFWIGGFLLLILAFTIIYFDRNPSGMLNPFLPMPPLPAAPSNPVIPAGLKPKTGFNSKPLLPKRVDKPSDKSHPVEDNPTLRDSHSPMEYKGEPRAVDPRNEINGDAREQPREQPREELREEPREEPREEFGEDRGDARDATPEGSRTPASVVEEERPVEEPAPLPPVENNFDPDLAPIDLSE